jgi:hypothetical protein
MVDVACKQREIFRQQKGDSAMGTTVQTAGITAAIDAQRLWQQHMAIYSLCGVLRRLRQCWPTVRYHVAPSYTAALTGRLAAVPESSQADRNARGVVPPRRR